MYNSIGSKLNILKRHFLFNLIHQSQSECLELGCLLWSSHEHKSVVSFVVPAPQKKLTLINWHSISHLLDMRILKCLEIYARWPSRTATQKLWRKVFSLILGGDLYSLICGEGVSACVTCYMCVSWLAKVARCYMFAIFAMFAWHFYINHWPSMVRTDSGPSAGEAHYDCSEGTNKVYEIMSVMLASSQSHPICPAQNWGFGTYFVIQSEAYDSRAEPTSCIQRYLRT